MTPKERVEQLERIFKEGGEQALNEFMTTNPVEYLKALEAGRMDKGVDSDHPPHWTQRPMAWVLVGTLIVSIIGLFGLVKFATQTVVESGQKYVPPTMVDGEIVPGHFE